MIQGNTAVLPPRVQKPSRFGQEAVYSLRNRLQMPVSSCDNVGCMLENH